MNTTDTLTAAAQLLARRKAVVPQGVGVFAPTTAVRGEGAVFYDADGQAWLDFGAGIGVTTVGHCPPPVVEAIRRQAGELLHACFHVSTYEPYVALCEKLTARFPHGGPTKAMLTNSGAESVENAVKIARQATGRSGVLCYTEAFHGRTMMAMTLTSKVSYKKHCGPFAPEVYRLQYPSHFHYGDGLTYDAFVRRELERLKNTFQNRVPANELAAIILELVQGEGGFNVAPPEYIHGLRQVCNDNGIMLIFDEVQSGFCRTGKWCAFEHFGVTPDISTWAKALGAGLPIGAVIGKAEVMDAAAAGTIGGTYLGNPIACAAALASLQYMEDEDLCGRAEAIGNTLRARLTDLQKRCPAVGDIRGLGAMLAMELVDGGKPASELTDALLNACWARHLLILPAGVNRNIIRFLMPLVLTDAQLNQGLDILEEELLRLWAAR